MSMISNRYDEDEFIFDTGNVEKMGKLTEGSDEYQENQPVDIVSVNGVVMTSPIRNTLVVSLDNVLTIDDIINNKAISLKVKIQTYLRRTDRVEDTLNLLENDVVNIYNYKKLDGYVNTSHICCMASGGETFDIDFYELKKYFSHYKTNEETHN